MTRRRPQAVRSRRLVIEGSYATWYERADAALGGIAVFVGVILIVIVLSLLGPQ